MTEQELQSIEARAAQATRGPWVWYEGYDSLERVKPRPSPDFGSEGGLFNEKSESVVRGCWCNDGTADAYAPSDQDAAFIAAARTDVPALCTDLRRFRAFARRLVACYDGESSDLFALVREVRAALGEGE